MVGNCPSFTLTVNEQFEIFPAASVALQLTVVKPIGNEAPLANPPVKAVVTPGQLSVAVTT